jgi:hypothetical protein
VGEARNGEARSDDGLLADRVVGAIFALIGVASLGDLLWRWPPRIWEGTGPGPAFLPLLLAVLVLGLSLILVAGRAKREAVDEADEQVPVGQTVRFIALIVGLIVVFPWLGGLLALGLFVFVEMVWIERSRILVAAIGLVVTLLAVEAIFVRVLAVPLPTGLFGV